MNRKCWLLGSFLCLLSAATAFAWIWWSPRTAITPENYERIELGITQMEVEEILGGPARDEATGPLQNAGEDCDVMKWREWVIRSSGADERPGQPFVRYWFSDELIVECCFDSAGQLTGKECMHVRPYRRSPLQLIADWIHL